MNLAAASQAPRSMYVDGAVCGKARQIMLATSSTT